MEKYLLCGKIIIEGAFAKELADACKEYASDLQDDVTDPINSRAAIYDSGRINGLCAARNSVYGEAMEEWTLMVGAIEQACYLGEKPFSIVAL